MATREIGLNETLPTRDQAHRRTGRADRQLAGDTPSHILVPAIHYRGEIRDIFQERMGDAPADLRLAGRTGRGSPEHLRRRFLAAGVAISSANFAKSRRPARWWSSSQGNGRMCRPCAR